ncbi:MAG: amidohydrolase [Chitinophagaceae bacterium]
MTYQKLQATQLFTGFQLLNNDYVLVVKNNGEIEKIIPVSEAGEGIEKFEGILSPGFINCHCHLELSHMKGLIPEQTGLVDFVLKVVNERHHSTEKILEAIARAVSEMQNNGIVAVGDICNNDLTIAEKQRKNLHYYNFIEASGWLPQISKIRFERAHQLYQQFKTKLPDCEATIVPHAPYSVSENLWQEIQPYFQNETVTIHNQETVFEDEFFTTGSGEFLRLYEKLNIDNSHHQPAQTSSLQSYFEKLTRAKNILLVHNTFTKQEDISFVQRQTNNHQLQIFFCLCANANLYIEKSLPPVELLMSNNCQLVLGTDSLASNWSLNILDEIKTIQKNFPQIAIEEMMKWATINGAKALNMAHELGSFEKGKRPGVNLITPKMTVKKII